VALLWFALVLLAVLCTWILGNLPWVMDGFRIRSDHAGSGTSTEGLSEVRLAIPLVAGRITELVAFTVVGSVSATLLPLAFTDLPRSLAVVTAGLVVATTTLVITFSSRSGIASHAADAFAGDERVLDGLVTGVLVVALVAAVVGSLAAAQIGFLPVATAVLVGQLPVWIGALVTDHALADLLYRLAAVVLLTAAFVISVRRSHAWVVLWPVALLLVWTALPLQIATGRLQDRLRPAAGLGSAHLSDVVGEAGDLFRATFWHAPQVWWPGVLAAVLAALWVFLVRRDPGSATPGRGDPAL
jgi:hypothetical protein